MGLKLQLASTLIGATWREQQTPASPKVLPPAPGDAKGRPSLRYMVTFAICRGGISVNISHCKCFRSSMFRFRFLRTAVVALFLAAPAFGQTGASPWENAVNVLQQAFTSTIARGLSLVAIVVAGRALLFCAVGLYRVATPRPLWSLGSAHTPALLPR